MGAVGENLYMESFLFKLHRIDNNYNVCHNTFSNCRYHANKMAWL